jgi:predicted HTH transcriptional regulator
MDLVAIVLALGSVLERTRGFESSECDAEFRTSSSSLARLGPDAGAFVRVGSTTRCAETAQIEEMRRFGRVGSFDEQPIPELNSDVLDFRAASEFSMRRESIASCCC